LITEMDSDIGESLALSKAARLRTTSHRPPLVPLLRLPTPMRQRAR
jgi:hypothetical protein